MNVRRCPVSQIAGWLGQGVVALLMALLALWVWFGPELGAERTLSRPLALISPINNPVLRLDKGADNTRPRVGDVVTFTLSYANVQTDSVAYNVRLYEFLPAGARYLSASPNPASIIDGNTLLFEFLSLGPGPAQGEVQVRTLVLPGHEAWDNHALLVANDVTPTAAALPLEILPATDKLNLTKHNGVAAFVGRELVYTLRCHNRSKVSFNGVWLEDVLPTGVTFVSASVTPTTVAPPILAWNVGTLGPGGLWEVVITTTAPTQAGVVTNTATLYAPSHVPVHALFATQVITQGAILHLSKGASGGAVYPGSTLIYTLRYENGGDLKARDVVLTDTFPAEVVPVTASPAPDVTAADRWEWWLGNLDAGQQGVVVVTATVHSTARGYLHNRAGIRGQNAWPNFDDLITQVKFYELYLPLVMRR